MSKVIVEYSFLESNKETLIFVPGYSGGLEVSTIKELADYFLQQGGYNVFGLNLDYQNDVQDEFYNSQESLVKAINEISHKVPNSSITLVAKSIGGSLAIFNVEKLPVSKIVVLGCSIILGWPQRISLLKSENQTIPDYKNEWKEILEGISVPTLILSGSSDDLSDNKYLVKIADHNQKLQVVIIGNANHNLEDASTGEFISTDVIKNVRQFI